MRISYNAPVVLTFIFAALGVFLLDQYLLPGITRQFFTTCSLGKFGVLHPLGHANWAHFAGNATFLLLLGPILEEKFGSVKLFSMILITAFTDVIISQYFFHSCGLGASGIVFMFIMLSSINHTKDRSIPLTFVLVAVIFLGKEILDSFKADNVSQAGHLIGGLCGAAYGFVLRFKT